MERTDHESKVKGTDWVQNFAEFPHQISPSQHDHSLTPWIIIDDIDIQIDIPIESILSEAIPELPEAAAPATVDCMLQQQLLQFF